MLLSFARSAEGMATAAPVLGFLAISMFCATLPKSTALSCWGKDSINTSSNAWCSEPLATPYSMSMCLYQMSTTEEACTASDQCMTVTAAATWPSLSSSNSSQPMVLSFAGCFKQNLTAYVCLDAQSFETDAMPTDGTLSVEEATTTTAKSTSSGALTSRLSTTRPSSTTPTTMPVTSQPQTSYRNVGSCAYSTVNFANPTCSVGTTTHARLANGTGGIIDVNFIVTSCCNDSDRCNNYGARPSFASWCYECQDSGEPPSASRCGRVAVCSACWVSTTFDANGITKNFRGCKVGMMAAYWPELTAQPPPSCTAAYQQSTCKVFGNQTICYRCCTGFLCNGWTAVIPQTKAPFSGQGRLTAGLLRYYISVIPFVLLLYSPTIENDVAL